MNIFRRLFVLSSIVSELPTAVAMAITGITMKMLAQRRVHAVVMPSVHAVGCYVEVVMPAVICMLLRSYCRFGLWNAWFSHLMLHAFRFFCFSKEGKSCTYHYNTSFKHIDWNFFIIFISFLYVKFLFFLLNGKRFPPQPSLNENEGLPVADGVFFIIRFCFTVYY